MCFMKILVIGDLHGRMPRIHFKKFDCIIQIGDVCDDREFRPYYKKWFKKLKEKDYNESIDSLLLRELGEKTLKKLEEDSIRKGRKILKYLSSFGKPLFFIPGNWDFSYGKITVKDPDKNIYNYLKYFYQAYRAKNSNPKLVRGIKNLYDCQYKLYNFLEINLVGYGLISGRDNVSRVRKKVTKKQYSILKKMHEKIEFTLNNLFKRRNKKLPTIFLSHNVPYGILDKIKDKKNVNYGLHFGSQLAKKMCFKFKPILCIAGHMHENPGKKKLGSTTVINTGYGRDAQILIDLDEKKMKIRKINFWKIKKK